MITVITSITSILSTLISPLSFLTDLMIRICFLLTDKRTEDMPAAITQAKTDYALSEPVAEMQSPEQVNVEIGQFIASLTAAQITEINRSKL